MCQKRQWRRFGGNGSVRTGVSVAVTDTVVEEWVNRDIVVVWYGYSGIRIIGDRSNTGSCGKGM